MIKVDKSRVAVPVALTDKKVEKKRNQLLRNKNPWGRLNSSYSQPYKSTAVVNGLESLYHKKCCFCEQPIQKFKEQGKTQPNNARTIEHYRPKSVYRWLAYSWDNLLLCCKGCNQPKGDDFPLEGTQITTASPSDLAVNTIHCLAVTYNAIELPLYPHPEIENPRLHLIFDTKGLIDSENPRYKYLIEKCKLNERQELVELRKKIYDDFKMEYDIIQIASISNEEKTARLMDLVQGFIKKCTPKEPFTAYRLYVFKHIIKPLLAG